MSDEEISNPLCSKIREVIRILRDSECSLPDDTYLDHMVAGISGELLKYQNSSTRWDFWISSNCSNFVQSFAEEKEGCQQFILRLLNQVCLTHWDINNQCLKIIIEVIEVFQLTRIIPNQTYLDLVLEACVNANEVTDTKTVGLFIWYPRSELPIWEMLITPIILMPSSHIPKSHFWQTSFIKLTSKMVTYCFCLLYTSDAADE